MVSSPPRKLSNEREGEKKSAICFLCKAANATETGKVFPRSALSEVPVKAATGWKRFNLKKKKKSVKANIFTVQKGHLDLLSSVKGCGFYL